jgi:hypothetical protein
MTGPGRVAFGFGDDPSRAFPPGKERDVMLRPSVGGAVAVVVLASACVALWTGCSKDLMSADVSPPAGSTITDPEDGAALNSRISDVRGRAEVGATIEIGVNGDFGAGYTATAWPDGRGDGIGRFTVEGVDLGEEGEKEIEAVVTDLFGNRSAEPVSISVTLDLTAPSVAFVNLRDATWDDDEGRWTTGLPRVTLVCNTDATASGARVRYGQNEFRPDSLGADGEAMSYRIPMTAPPLSAADPESLVHYHIEAFDEAGNTSSEPLNVYWAAAGKETLLSWDDGVPGMIQDYVTGQDGWHLAVLFEAPPWANYITGAEFYIMNDNETNPNDPEAPSTWPFRIRVWRPTPGGLPGAFANEGYIPCGEYGCYPEAQIVGWDLPNAIDITNHEHFPDKTFFLGMEWMHRSNPRIALDRDPPIDSRSFQWDWESWKILPLDAIVHARVSDVQSMGPEARTAVLRPAAVGAFKLE